MCGTFCGLCQIFQNAESLGQSGEDNFGFLKDFYGNLVRHPLLPSGPRLPLRPRHAAQTRGQREVQH